MVEKVEEIKLELHLDAFRDSEVLAHREIHVIVAGTAADANSRASGLTQFEAIQRVGVGVEPLSGVAVIGTARLASNTHGPLQTVAAGARRIAHVADAVNNRCQRRAGHFSDDRADLP